MKLLIHFLLFFAVTVLSASTTIDECKSDLYYANGIMMELSAMDALEQWNDKVNDIFQERPDSYEKLAGIKIAYNTSQGFVDDLLEALEQTVGNEWGWGALRAYITVYLTTHNIQEDWQTHVHDLSVQIENYKQSVRNGHGVIVIAHSQGNYFTNEAYVQLDDWMQQYFHMFGVATPANHVAGYASGDITAPYVTFHNDFINAVVTGLPSNMDDTRHHGFPSIAAHDFYENYLAADNSRAVIIDYIEAKLVEHTQAPSQWQTNEEYDIDTINYRITGKHRFDPDNIIMNEEVYPFAPSKKLYQVDGEYVKASCGGTEILASWEGQEDSEFYLLEGTGEKIENKHKVLRYGPVNMTKVIYVENPPATVKSIECWLPTVRMTYETYSVSIDNGVIKKELIAQRDMGNQSGSYVLINGLDSYYITQKYGCISGLQECFVTEDNLETYLDLVATNAMPTDMNQVFTYKYPGYPVGMQHAYSIRTMILDDGTELYEGYEFIYSEISAEDAKQQSDSFLGITGHYMRSCESTEFDKDFNDIYDTKIYGAYF